MTPAEMFKHLADVDGYLSSDTGERVKRAAEEDWPSKAHPENVWARDRSVKQFTATVEPERIVIENGADYSGYTDGGFTRAGRATADPYAKRGATDYLEQTANRIVDDEATRLVRHLEGSRG